MNPLLRVSLLLVIAGLSIPVAGLTAQILRPTGGGNDEILEIERVVRMRLALPVDREIAFDAWTVSTALVEWLPHWVEMQVAEGEGFSM